MISNQTTVTSTATKVVTAAAHAWRTVVIRPVGADVYLGNSTVTTTNGLKLDNGTLFSYEIPPGQELYAVVSSGSHTVMTLTSSEILG